MSDEEARIKELEKRVKELEEEADKRAMKRMEGMKMFLPHDLMHQPMCTASRMLDPPTGRREMSEEEKKFFDEMAKIKKKREAKG